MTTDRNISNVVPYGHMFVFSFVNFPQIIPVGNDLFGSRKRELLDPQRILLPIDKGEQILDYKEQQITEKYPDFNKFKNFRF